MAQKSSVHVQFYTEAVPDGAASRAANRQVFTEVEMCKVLTIGDKDNNLVIRAHEPFMIDRANGGHMTPAQRWPDEYRAFKENMAEAVSGTPLSHLPFLSKAQVAEFKVANIRTAEQLAGLGEAAIAKGFRWRELRDQAAAWLDESEKFAVVAKAQEAEAKAKVERDEMAQRLAAMESKLAALDEPKRGPGRPRKEEAA